MLDLLGGHVLRRADDLAGAGQRQVLRLAAHQLRDAEVGDLHPALLVEQDVFRLDVAVDHAVVVGVLQGVANLRHDGQGFLGCELARVQQPPQVHAVDELHEEVVERSAPSPPTPLPPGEGRSSAPNRKRPRRADG